MLVNEDYATLGKHRILYRTVLPDKKNIKGVFVLIHGIGDHSARYFEWMELFCEKGFAWITADLPGHGLSSGKRGHTGPMSQLFYLIDFLLHQARQHFPSVPLILYGHSMGGNIAANYVLIKKPDIHGLILTAPWLGLVRPPSKAAILLGRMFLPLFPTLSLSTRIRREQLNNDPEYLEKSEKDGLIHGWISLQTFMDNWDAIRTIRQNAGKLFIPTLIIHGTADPITDWQVSEKFAHKAGQKSIFAPLNGELHAIHAGKQKQTAATIINNWFDKTFTYGH